MPSLLFSSGSSKQFLPLTYSLLKYFPSEIILDPDEFSLIYFMQFNLSVKVLKRDHIGAKKHFYAIRFSVELCKFLPISWLRVRIAYAIQIRIH
jgi:hypothetical protein